MPCVIKPVTGCWGTMNKHAKIYVAGHRGLVGSALVRALTTKGYSRLVTRTRQELDLTEQAAVEHFFKTERPDVVIDAAARVGGIHANSAYPAEFIRDNLSMQTHLVDSAYRSGVKKFVFLGSSCIYPKHAPQPLKEDYLLTGPLEPTNEWYAVAKIAGIKLCQAYRRQYGFDAISLMPTNLYGSGDNFSLENSHVLPALIRKFHEAKWAGAKSVTVWGTGTPRREFLHVDDLAEAVVFLMENYSAEDIINVGVGEDISIRELAETIREIVGFEGDLVFDPEKPDGTPRKLLDVSKLHSLGWRARIPLRQGIEETYRWFLAHQNEFRR
ncbi:GDP-L-fucose synthase [Methylocaldum szegediense]|uniref:GDP-L-fucose synthase n=2 Tax=Methylocaldum szegediense TaxID=73780 RepID=A0ABN8X2X7_9GAMM|nr:GDP-L-fucose synthase [Methylocaldum szegediense]